jgi:hypothetical protein
VVVVSTVGAVILKQVGKGMASGGHVGEYLHRRWLKHGRKTALMVTTLILGMVTYDIIFGNVFDFVTLHKKYLGFFYIMLKATSARHPSSAITFVQSAGGPAFGGQACI